MQIPTARSQLTLKEYLRRKRMSQESRLVKGTDLLGDDAVDDKSASTSDDPLICYNRVRDIALQSQRNRGRKIAELTGTQIMLNHQRAVNGHSPLQRVSFLDKLARLHASKMARTECLSSSVDSSGQLQERLHSLWVEERVFVGDSTREIHEAAIKAFLMDTQDEIFIGELGLAAVVGAHGKIYGVILRRGSPTANE